jgi:molybdate transport system substrate-binding protein
MRWKASAGGLAGCLGLLVSSAALAQSAAVAQPPHRPIQVRVAFALERPLRRIAAAYTRQTGVPVILSFAGSARIAREVEAGEGDGVVVCAERWMAPMAEEGDLDGPVRPLVSTRLVLVAPVGATVPIQIGDGFAFGSAIGESHLAIGDPISVPSGYYGKLAVLRLGGWLKVAPKVVRAPAGRNVLDMVAAGKAIVGIVFDTDAKADPRVKIVGYFPQDHYPRIGYAAAAAGEATPDEHAFVRYLAGPEATETFAALGFVPEAGRGPPRRDR